MMQTTRYSNNGPVHLAINDGENTFPICGTKLRWGLPQQVDHEITCKKCQKMAA